MALVKRWLLWTGAALLVSAAPVAILGQDAPKKKPSHSASSSSKSAKSKSGTSSKSPSRTSGKSKRSKRQPPRRKGQTSPSSDRIREIQSALAQSGNYSGEPSGKWDASTTDSMKKFQESQGLKPTGKLDAITLQKLGLGSPVAGLAPPRQSQNGTVPKSGSPHK